jgi:hypothetical protein
VIRRKNPVIPVPVLARRWHEIGEPVEKLKRRESDDATGPRPRGLPPAPPPDPGGRLVPLEHVADAGDAAVWTAGHGKPLKRKRRPGAVAQQVFETLEVARHVAVDGHDPHPRVDLNPAVLPAEDSAAGGMKTP